MADHAFLSDRRHFSVSRSEARSTIALTRAGTRGILRLTASRASTRSTPPLCGAEERLLRQFGEHQSDQAPRAAARQALHRRKQIGCSTSGANDPSRCRRRQTVRAVYTFECVSVCEHHDQQGGLRFRRQFARKTRRPLARHHGAAIGDLADGCHMTERAASRTRSRYGRSAIRNDGRGEDKSVDACMATYAMLEKGKEEAGASRCTRSVDAAAWDKVFGGPVPGCCGLRSCRYDRGPADDVQTP